MNTTSATYNLPFALEDTATVPLRYYETPMMFQGYPLMTHAVALRHGHDRQHFQ
ncbi:hypothetical protein [Acidiferrobacter sp.]|uniref:hypothetical protein n=1 Tax=Acidiferrobacter sp. TaxID=1872107 RepID=UPI002620544F|nr:hypothetical protein [Acidiferrobacter sp.]